MAKNIEPKLKKIGDYLALDSDIIFTIPEYQRPYSWGIVNCDKLWQDILDFMDSGGKDNYFFGTIIINCQDNDSIYALIDGQQRTTTFFLLLKALLIRINIAIQHTVNDEDSATLCRGLKQRRTKLISMLYKIDGDEIPDTPCDLDDKALYSNVAVIKNNSINELYKAELHIILSSVTYEEAETAVYKIPRRQKDNKYTNFFRNFKFFYEKTTELSNSELNQFTKTLIDSCEVIEIKSWQVEQAITMFNSLNSDGMPLHDADIISAKLYAEAEKQGISADYNEQWKQLIELVDELQSENIVNINAILMQQMYYERAKNREILTDTGSINVTTPGLRRYYTEINKSILMDPVGLCSQMMNLAKIWQKVASYPIMQIVFKFNDNSRLFLAGYFHRFNVDDITEAAVEKIAYPFIRLFALLELVDIGYSSSLFKTFLFEESLKLVDSNVSVDVIRDDFDQHISRRWKSTDIEKYIVDYDKNVLVYLNEYLFAKENGQKLCIGAKCDIEHIMPASGANIDAIRMAAGIESKEEFDSVVNKLGNKILLEERINRALHHDWFRTKVSTALSSKSGYVDSIYPIAGALVKKYKDDQNACWKKEDIDSTTRKACGRIVSFIFNK